MLVGGIAGLVAGWMLGWVEFVALGIGCLLAIITAIPFILGGTELEVTRRLDPDRVQVGDEATSVLEVRNVGRRKSAGRLIADHIGSTRHLIDVSPLDPDSLDEFPLALPTERRAMIQVGPAEISKGDPLGTLRRALSTSDVTHFFVHPRVVPLHSLQSGFVKDLEGPTYDTSPAGDVAFHTIREYAPGDDVRHIHWMSTARTGSLMIRHYVDNRRPYIGILVDNRSSSMSPDDFERAIEVAASQIVSAAKDGRPITVWVGTQCIVSESDPADVRQALDRLCMSKQVGEDHNLTVLQDRLRRTNLGVSALLVLTGKLDPTDLLDVVTSASREVAVIVGRSGPAGDARAIPGAITVDFADTEGFAHQWRGLAS